MRGVVELVKGRSTKNVAETVAELRTLITEAGAQVFTVIDHAAAAREAGLEMPDTQVVVFGKPRTGTPLMLANPDLALELPSKILVRQNADGSTDVLTKDPAELAERYGVSEEPLRAEAVLVSKISAS